MNTVSKKVFTMACAFLVVSAGIRAAEPPSLAHNPFVRPQLDELRVARNAGGDDLQSNESLQLTATMVSGSMRFASANGRILRTGDKIFGYTLQRVFENRAVFSKNGKQTTVFVKPKLEESYDEEAAE